MWLYDVETAYPSCIIDIPQWFLNLFERDPNRDVCKISRPKAHSSIEILKGIAILFTILSPFYYIQHSKQPESNEMPEL